MRDMLDVLMIAVLGVLSLWLVLTRISLVFPRIIRCGFLPDPESRRVMDRLGAKSRALVEALEALGFERLGVRFERGLFGLGVVRSICFASKKDRVFASIVLSRRKAESYFLLSTFENGAVVFTSNNPGLQRPIATSDCRYGAVLQGTPAELLHVHRQRVLEFERQGYALAQDFSHEGRNAATRAYYRNPTLTRRFRALGLLAILQSLLILGAMAFAAIHALQRLEKNRAPHATDRQEHQNDPPPGAGAER